MKSDKVSFGTRPEVGYYRAINGLPKYSKKLTLGLLDAFEKLSANGVEDHLFMGMSPKHGAKNLTTDVIELCYYTKPNSYQSITAFSPKTLAKRSVREISEFIISTYEELKKSNKKVVLGRGFPISDRVKAGKEHWQKILELTRKHRVS